MSENYSEADFRHIAEDLVEELRECEDGTDINNATIGGGSGDEKEQEANYFAACLLMPSDEVDRFIDLELPDFEMSGLSGMDIARIMSEFNVSYDVALNRLESLGKIDANDGVTIRDRFEQLVRTL